MTPILSEGARTVKIMTILVTGATGNIGRLVVDELIRLGGSDIPDIRALTKNPAKGNLPDEVDAITGYLGDPDTLPAALEGVERMYLAPLPSTLDVTLDLAKKAGVQYVVALSGGAHWQEHTDTIAASGLVSTQLGPGEFLENFAMWSEPIKATRTVREPYPEVLEAPISMYDIARVAATLLVKPEQVHFGQTYELTGPEALTRAQIAEQIGVGIGAEVRYEKCSLDEAREQLRPLMGDEVDWYLELMKDAEPQRANQLVGELTGTPAESVARWAARNAELFRS